jgi:hypothetical protein
VEDTLPACSGAFQGLVARAAGLPAGGLAVAWSGLARVFPAVLVVVCRSLGLAGIWLGRRRLRRWSRSRGSPLSDRSGRFAAGAGGSTGADGAEASAGLPARSPPGARSAPRRRHRPFSAVAGASGAAKATVPAASSSPALSPACASGLRLGFGRAILG